MESIINVIGEVYGWVLITIVIHELSHLIPIIIQRKLCGLVIGFVDGKWYKLVVGVTANHLNNIDVLAPQIVVPAVFWVLSPLLNLEQYVVIAALAANVAGGALDYRALIDVRKSAKTQVKFYGVGLFFNQFSVRHGWL